MAGFTRRVAHIGDLVYFVVKVDKKTLCGARGRLKDITDNRPWDNADSYPQAFTLDNIEYCEPFEVKLLSEVGGRHWNLKYLQGAKSIEDGAVQLLNEEFTRKTRPLFYVFGSIQDLVETEEDDSESPGEVEGASQDDSQINIMGTFLTIKFHSEQNKVTGLEKLVNDNFFELFEEFPKEKTLLISNNRLFKTAGIVNSKKEKISGVSGIPDAILIRFKADEKYPLQINLIEYECYGEVKSRPVEKFNYLNGHIIPQLMRFASTFSVVTDSAIRDQTVRNWTQKIIDYIYSNDEATDMVAKWVRTLHPNLREQQISLHVNNMLLDAFKTNIRLVLVIDELTADQRDTIRNVVGSFKLENEGESVGFSSYVVRLQQKINTIDADAEFALSVQKY